MSKPLVTVATLIYASPAYLESVIDSLTSHVNASCDVQYLVVANDPWPTVVNYLSSPKWAEYCAKWPIKTVIHLNENPKEYYINNVYRAWRKATDECETDIVCFVNSDMKFTNGWLDSLLKYDLDKCVPTSRLVECGRMPSLEGLISKNFGQTLAEIDTEGFEKFAAEVSEPNRFTVNRGGFMPAVYLKERLQAVGGWHLNENGIPGDQITMFLLWKHFQMVHVMCHDSIVLHWQRGESHDVGDAD